MPPAAAPLVPRGNCAACARQGRPDIARDKYVTAKVLQNLCRKSTLFLIACADFSIIRHLSTPYFRALAGSPRPLSARVAVVRRKRRHEQQVDHFAQQPDRAAVASAPPPPPWPATRSGQVGDIADDSAKFQDLRRSAPGSALSRCEKMQTPLWSQRLHNPWAFPPGRTRASAPWRLQRFADTNQWTLP